MSVCPINVETAEPIAPKFCVRPQIIPGKTLNAQNYKSCVQKFWTCVKF